ncbi:DNA-directed RNA polymerase subunit alpha [Candidatus Beckwithbacteria bacterium]|nr:DNA-directed RNA polymerase subunit alpha [Candidatus Beckwithbacteria bacterium]
MLQPQFKIETLEEKDGYAKLSIEPLEQGYGHTLGNALRRTLLTSIKGAAAASVKIDGVKHRFSTLSGMKEDVVEFCLQLKQLRIKYEGDEPVELRLEVSGKKEITAAAIEAPAGVEILNPELVLAHLSDAKAKLKAIITVESGYGYKLAEERRTSTVGVIPLDTAYSPILRVKYDVKETRVGQRTDFDNLLLDIWTDGTVKPQDAVVSAAKTLISYFNQIVDPVLPEKEEKEEIDPHEQEVMRLTVEELDLPTRIANALRKGGFETVKDLSKASKDEIAKVKNLGGKSVDIVVEKLVEKGISVAAE